MDKTTEQVLKLINSHIRIKNFLTILCYCLIFGGLFIYVFHAFDRNKTIKLVSQYKENQQNYKSEKIMTNPRINLQYNDTQIYHIQAKKAYHKDEQQVTLQDVFAEGDIGNITSGELKVDEDGNHLVFSKNPILILNKTSKQ